MVLSGPLAQTFEHSMILWGIGVASGSRDIEVVGKIVMVIGIAIMTGTVYLPGQPPPPQIPHE